MLVFFKARDLVLLFLVLNGLVIKLCANSPEESRTIDDAELQAFFDASGHPNHEASQKIHASNKRTKERRPQNHGTNQGWQRRMPKNGHDEKCNSCGGYFGFTCRCDASAHDCMNDPEMNIIMRRIQLNPPIIVPVPVITPTATVAFTNFAIVTDTATRTVTRGIAYPVFTSFSSVPQTTITYSTSSGTANIDGVLSVTALMLGLLLLVC